MEGGDGMKIEKNITRVEIIDTLEQLNKALKEGAVLIETLKTSSKDYDGFVETVQFIVGY